MIRQLFHGSPSIIEKPQFGYGKVYNDYGLGFYCTDSLEMAKGSRKTLVIQSEKLPIIEGVEEYAQMGLIPEGAYRNRDFAGDEVRSEIKELWMEDLVFDPQTSGGLLLAVPAEEADALAEEFAGMDIFGGVIGYVTELQDKAVVFE